MRMERGREKDVMDDEFENPLGAMSTDYSGAESDGGGTSSARHASMGTLCALLATARTQEARARICGHVGTHTHTHARQGGS
jgi:hypothetical protein